MSSTGQRQHLEKKNQEKKHLFPMQLSPLNSNMLEMAMVLQLKTTEEPLTTLTAEPFDSDLFICGVFLHHLQG